MNRFLRAVQRLSGRTTAGDLGGGPGGVVDLGPLEFDAVLAGSTSPYTFTQVRGIPGGTWTPLAGGRTGTAYEYNAQSGLAGKVARVWRDRGTYRFDYIRRGGTVCHASLTVNVSGCPQIPDDFHYSFSIQNRGPGAGATVTVTRGTFSASAVADAAGHATFDLSGAGAGNGTYTVTVTADRYATKTITVNVGCYATPAFVALRPAPGYFCCALPPDRPTALVCPGVYPLVLHGTDGDGNAITFTAVRYAIGDPAVDPYEPIQHWIGVITVTQPGYGRDGYGNCTPATVSKPVRYTLFCDGGGPTPQLRLRQEWPIDCFPTGLDPSQDSAYLGGDLSFVTRYREATSPDCGTPLLATFTLPAEALIPGEVVISE
jgi:hypothetical protein